MELNVTTTLLLVFCVTFLCVFCRRHARFVRLKNKLPGPSLWEVLTVYRKPLMGNTFHYIVCQLTEKFGFKPWGFWIYTNLTIVVSDSETISEVYKNKALVDKPGLFYGAAAAFTGHNILTLNGSQHRRNRTALNPAFQKSKLDMHQQKINLAALKFVQQLREKVNGEKVDIRHLVEDLLGTALLSTFSSNYIPLLKIKPCVPYLLECAKEIQLRTVNPLYYWLLHKHKRSTRAFESEFSKSLAELKKGFLQIKRLASEAMIENANKRPTNFMEVLAQHPSDQFKDEGWSEALMYFVAGVHTTSFTLNVALILLAMHPDVQEKVFLEAESIFGRSERDVDVQGLSAMTYLDMTIKETLRLFPAGAGIFKQANAEVTLNGMIVPAGTIVVINIMALHRNPTSFKDPLKYDPDRFSPERSQERHPCAFLPFSSGPRNCPGQQMAVMILKTTLCQVVRNFKILLAEKLESIEDIKTELYFTQQLSKSAVRFVSRH